MARHGAADSLADWVDTDADPRSQGAEADYYKQQGFADFPRNQGFTSVDEMIQAARYKGVIAIR